MMCKAGSQWMGRLESHTAKHVPRTVATVLLDMRLVSGYGEAVLSPTQTRLWSSGIVRLVVLLEVEEEKEGIHLRLASTTNGRTMFPSLQIALRDNSEESMETN